MSTPDAIAAEVHQWYDDYLDTFTGLASGERTDLEALLEYFGVPLVIVTDDDYLALTTREAVLSTIRPLIDQLRQANYARSMAHRLDIRPINARAATIEGEFSRHDRTEKELERLGVLYLVAKTDEGWRFASLVLPTP